MIKKLAVYHQFQINRPKYAFKINPPNFTSSVASFSRFIRKEERKTLQVQFEMQGLVLR